MSCGKEFHIFDAEWEKERSYSAERDLGMHKSPFSDDLRENECFSDKGVCASSKMVLASKLVLASIMVLTSLYIGPDWHLLWCANQTLKWS